MFSLPFLFPSSKDVIEEEIYQEAASAHLQQGDSQHNQYEYDSSSSCSSSSNESDSRFMNEQETPFIALHSHQRVQHLNQVAEQSSKLVPLHVASKGYDDVSQISLEYESSAASLDTSVDLNPYGSLSHLEVAMRWKKNLVQQKSLESISDTTPGSGKVVVADNIHVPEKELSLTSYVSLSKLHGSVDKIVETDTVLGKQSRSSSSTEGYVGSSGNSPVLERTLRKASLSATRSGKISTFSLAGKKKGESNDANARRNSFEVVCPPPPPPQIVKKKYSGSQFQISPLKSSRKAVSSDYPLSASQGRFTTKTSKEKDEENKPKVKLVLGSGRDRNDADMNEESPVIVIPVSGVEENGSFTQSDNLRASIVNWQAPIINWPTEGKDVPCLTPKSPNPETNQTPTPCQTPPEFSNMTQSRIGRESLVPDNSSDSTDSSIPQIPKSSPCQKLPCSMFNTPSGSPTKSQFLMRLSGLKTQGVNEINEISDTWQSTQNCANDASIPTFDPKAASLQQGAHGLQHRTKKWVTQIWSPESEEWDYIQDESFATASMPSAIHFEDFNSTMPMTDEDEDSLECIFKQADEKEKQRQRKSSLLQLTPDVTERKSLSIGRMPSNQSDSSESSLVYSMSTASMMESSRNIIERSLSKPIAFRRARESYISPSKLGIMPETNESENQTSFETTRQHIMEAAELNYNLLTEFEVRDRHIAATMIQTAYRGYNGRYRVMEMVSDRP